MKKYFSVGEAAKAVHTTSETLRHYDRIGLVRPSKKDEWTNYRYYTEQDIVRLNTVRALQIMDLPLQEIKRVLEYSSLKKIVDFLVQAEKKADEKIATLQYSKSKIQLAKADYEKKLQERKNRNGMFLKNVPERVILLSDTLGDLIYKAKAEYGASAEFTVQLITVSGILHWNYEVQVYVGK